jgi:hypothetical protein
MRLFSMLTMCVLGAQMIANCVLLLRTRAADALAIALATFLVPAFIYSVLDPSAWVPHLMSMLLVLLAYAFLGRSNLQAVPFLVLARERSWWALGRQVGLYARLRPVWLACLVVQAALYDYPAFALIIVAFPVIAVLFSQAPSAYRALIAVRDLVFVAANLALFALSAKLIYFPIVRLFSSQNAAAPDAATNPFLQRVGQTYRFAFSTDPGEILARLGRLMKVAGDLWFLPQTQFHVAAGLVIALAVVVGVAAAALARGSRLPGLATNEDVGRLKLASWDSGLVAAMVVVVGSLLVSTSTVLLPVGGIVVYRTAAVPTVIVAIVFLFSLRLLVEVVLGALAGAWRGVARAADAVLVVALCAAAAANFYSNRVTLTLARNEFAYFTALVRQAVADKSTAIILVDPRPLTLPEDHPLLADGKGRAVPPYELGCFSGYCLQDGSIIHIAARELGVPDKQLQVYVQRENDPVPGFTCELLATPKPTYPPNASRHSVGAINFFRKLAPFSCVTYSLAWHDLGTAW